MKIEDFLLFLQLCTNKHMLIITNKSAQIFMSDLDTITIMLVSMHMMTTQGDEHGENGEEEQEES